MSVGHYENFPVASFLLPARLRHPVAVIYRFARSADDFADEGDLTAGARLALLDGYRHELGKINRGEPVEDALFVDLKDIVHRHKLPLQLFYDLLDAFSQDVVKIRYADQAELLDYSRRSANPVGRLLLHLYRETSTENLACSDAICSALQLINFWQDIAIDWKKDRVYLPRDTLARYDVREQQIARGDTGGRWREMIAFEVARTRAMINSGAPLALRLPGRIGLELRLVVQGGLRILEKIDAVEGDVFRHRPVLGPFDWPLMFCRALLMR
ncbi:MAG: squalene synthase HpnC [Betaproteobacteria bacterium]